MNSTTDSLNLNRFRLSLSHEADGFRVRQNRISGAYGVGFRAMLPKPSDKLLVFCSSLRLPIFEAW